jgi:hypothetical protein
VGVTVVTPKHARLGEGFSTAEKLKAREHPGRRMDGSQSAASWVADLVGAKKVIILCGFCRPKFNPRKYAYRRMYSPDYTGKTDGYMTNGMCDGCKQQTLNTGGGTAYISEETYRMVCIDPVDARRQARAKARLAWASYRLYGKPQGARRPGEATGRR